MTKKHNTNKHKKSLKSELEAGAEKSERAIFYPHCSTNAIQLYSRDPGGEQW